MRKTVMWVVLMIPGCLDDGDNHQPPPIPVCEAADCADLQCGPNDPTLCTCIASDGAARLCELPQN